VGCRWWTAVVLAAALLVALPAGAQAGRLLAPAANCGDQVTLTQPQHQFERSLRCLINHARARQGMNQLRKKPALQQSAHRKAGDILDCQDFAHTACGRDTFYWFERVGYLIGCFGVGEDLAWGNGSLATARSTMARWLHSPEHRQVILNPRYESLGVAVRGGAMLGNDGANVWAAHFGYHC
jgi:uncharacterized protein YkwD